ncbi:MAG: MaoC/PaaZ C-terminal domain-containing protein [Chloroflexota bacterium]
MSDAAVRAYADASGDHNPLHLDAAFAANTPYGRPIAHGMLVLARLSELFTVAFDGGWLASGSLKVRFRAPVFPGQTVSAEATLKGEADGRATYEATVRNEQGEAVITGEASVVL